MHSIDIKRIEEALQQARDKLRQNEDSPLSEASIEARTSIGCLEFVLKSCVKEEAKPAATNDDAIATVKFAIFHGITTQWHKKDEQKFAEILMESIYKELFQGMYKWAIREVIKES